MIREESDGFLSDLWPKIVDLLYTIIDLGDNNVDNNGWTPEDPVDSVRRRPVGRRRGRKY